ncbi:MAG: hypothetical protein ACRC5A_16845 [Enterobacteriaceae bacterium]
MVWTTVVGSVKLSRLAVVLHRDIFISIMRSVHQVILGLTLAAVSIMASAGNLVLSNSTGAGLYLSFYLPCPGNNCGYTVPANQTIIVNCTNNNPYTIGKFDWEGSTYHVLFDMLCDGSERACGNLVKSDDELHLTHQCLAH